MIMTFVTSGLFYVVSGFLFWGSDYFHDVIKTPKNTVTITFACTSITAPIFGALASIPIVRSLGKDAYKSKWIMPILTLIATACACIGFFVTSYDEFWYIIGSFWFILFGGGMALPIF